MSKVLVIKSSMNTKTEKGSFSNAIADKFVEIYKSKNPEDQIEYLDINNDKAGTFSLTSENISSYWDDVDKYIDQLKSVDKLIVSSPMTNFNYPAVLKNYLDKVLVAGKTFKYKYDEIGASEGLVKNLKVQIITTQGAPKGWYPFGDHTISLTGTFKFMGAKVVEPLIVAGLKTPNMIKHSTDEVLEKFASEIKYSAEQF